MVMKYSSALKKYNEGSDKWCMPRKGSVDYLKIIKAMKQSSNSKQSSAKKSSSSSSKLSLLAMKPTMLAFENNGSFNAELGYQLT